MKSAVERPSAWRFANEAPGKIFKQKKYGIEKGHIER
jgi:hypothetical protein